jgi:hypothetical protein
VVARGFVISSLPRLLILRSCSSCRIIWCV